MKNLLVIKDQSNKAWSSSLKKLADECSNNDFDIYNVFRDKKERVDLSNYRNIIINHSICFYYFIFKYGFKNKIIFIPHEGEPFLGWKFAFNKKQLNRCGAFLRFSKLYNKIPYYFSNETLLLSDIQRPLYPNANTINLLGIDSNIFKPESGIAKDVDIFFPSNISAPEKGFSRISHLLNDYMVIYPESTPNDQMPNLYCRAKIVVIPSVFETYGLVVLEALFCNSVVLVSSNVGVVHELLKVYSESKLESMGLFISDFISNNEIEMKVRCAMNFQENNITMTRKLALDFGFAYKDSARKLIEYVRYKN